LSGVHRGGNHPSDTLITRFPQMRNRTRRERRWGIWGDLRLLSANQSLGASGPLLPAGPSPTRRPSGRSGVGEGPPRDVAARRVEECHPDPRSSRSSTGRSTSPSRSWRRRRSARSGRVRRASRLPCCGLDDRREELDLERPSSRRSPKKERLWISFVGACPSGGSSRMGTPHIERRRWPRCPRLCNGATAYVNPCRPLSTRFAPKLPRGAARPPTASNWLT
jgi:hypothetical protein